MSDPIIWKKLRTPLGPAGMVPRLVAQLSEPETDGPDHERWEAYDGLVESLVSAGMWGTASAPTVALLLEADQEADSFCYNLSLAADITAGVGLDYWVRSRKTEAVNEQQQSCWSEVSSRLDVILGCLRAESHRVRGASAFLLGVVPHLRAVALPALEERWKVETAAFARATILQALDELDDAGKWEEIANAIAIEGDSEPAVWGMASLIWLRKHACATNPGVLQGLVNWLSVDPEPRAYRDSPRLVLRGTPEGVLSALLEAQFSSHHDAVLDLGILLAHALPEQRVIEQTETVINRLLGLPLIPSEQKVIPAGELTADQRKVAEGLVDAPLYYEGGWMPGYGACRKRWLGLLPPSVLESPFALDPATDTPQQPLWEVWRRLDPARNKAIPRRLAERLTPAERWRAVVEGWLYGCGTLEHAGQLEPLVQSLTVDDDIEQTILALARENLARERLQGCTRSRGSGAPVQLLLLPLVRAGRPIPPDLYELVELRDTPAEREVMAHLPIIYLRDALREGLNGASLGLLYRVATELLSILDVAPDPALCDEFVRVRELVDTSQKSDYEVTLTKTASRVRELRAALKR
jgi:hypothetical protein